MNEKHATCPPEKCETCKCQNDKVYSGIELMEIGDNINLPEGMEIDEYLDNLKTQEETKHDA